jgi:hypothetical protein
LARNTWTIENSGLREAQGIWKWPGSLGIVIRNGMQVDGINYEETYKVQDGSQTLWFHDPLK